MGTMPSWSFLSNHGAVLLLVATVPQTTATQIGAQLGITERPVRRIISELESAGYIRRIREGRRNRYEANSESTPSRASGTGPGCWRFAWYFARPVSWHGGNRRTD